LILILQNSKIVLILFSYYLVLSNIIACNTKKETIEMAGFIIESNRLQLRNFKLSDAEYMYQLNQDDEVQRFTGDAPFANIEETQMFIAQYIQETNPLLCRWAVVLKSSNEYLGWCGLKLNKETMLVDLGFRFLKTCRNKGYATEASIACIQYAFETLKLKKVIGRARIENIPSIRVLQKAGMRPEKEIHYLGGNSFLYSMTREDYARMTEI
jgi:RimJ/RimL family protein N-acetyltransferase